MGPQDHDAPDINRTSKPGAAGIPMPLCAAPVSPRLGLYIVGDGVLSQNPACKQSSALLLIVSHDAANKGEVVWCMVNEKGYSTIP